MLMVIIMGVGFSSGTRLGFCKCDPEKVPYDAIQFLKTSCVWTVTILLFTYKTNRNYFLLEMIIVLSKQLSSIYETTAAE